MKPAKLRFWMINTQGIKLYENSLIKRKFIFVYMNSMRIIKNEICNYFTWKT